jgi:hypothetical protein
MSDTWTAKWEVAAISDGRMRVCHSCVQPGDYSFGRWHKPLMAKCDRCGQESAHGHIVRKEGPIGPAKRRGRPPKIAISPDGS